MSDDPIALFRRAAALADATVSAVRHDQLGHSTPCTEWTVRQLINHMLTGNLFFVSLATGAPPPDLTADHVGDDHVASFRDSRPAHARHRGIRDRCLPRGLETVNRVSQLAHRVASARARRCVP